jgi:hypothetical protein
VFHIFVDAETAPMENLKKMHFNNSNEYKLLIDSSRHDFKEFLCIPKGYTECILHPGGSKSASYDAAALVSVFSFDFENYNSHRKPAAQKINTIRLRDSCSPKSYALCFRASKMTSSGSKNKKKEFWNSFNCEKYANAQFLNYLSHRILKHIF